MQIVDLFCNKLIDNHPYTINKLKLMHFDYIYIYIDIYIYIYIYIYGAVTNGDII
jgi:hypothetical protein